MVDMRRRGFGSGNVRSLLKMMKKWKCNILLICALLCMWGLFISEPDFLILDLPNVVRALVPFCATDDGKNIHYVGTFRVLSLVTRLNCWWCDLNKQRKQLLAEFFHPTGQVASGVLFTKAMFFLNIALVKRKYYVSNENWFTHSPNSQ